MMRVIVSVLGVALIGVTSLLSADSRPVSLRPDPCLDESCKPTGPVDAHLVQSSANGGRVELALSVRPVRDLQSLRWELELPADASLVEGAREGLAAQGRDVETLARAVLSMPDDASFRRVVLTTHGVFSGSDETGATFPEAFTTSTVLSWGTPPVSAGTVRTRDGETGGTIEVVAVPTAHRSGR